MSNLEIVKERLDRITEELTQIKKDLIRLEVIDNEKIEKAWNDLMIASDEISSKWQGPSAVEEVRLQREKA